MKRLYEPAAYGPQGGCFWSETVEGPHWPQADIGTKGEMRADVAVIGGGFTGLNAALRLAREGASVVVFEAEHAGWGASGRNGGFCCLGGSKAPWGTIRKRHGAEGLAQWLTTERAAIDHVDRLISAEGLCVDRHSQGETQLAHAPRAWDKLQAEADDMATAYGTDVHLTPPGALLDEGLGGAWHGALTLPLGFALNPRKYHQGLAQMAAGAGAQLFANSPVTALGRAGREWQVTTPKATIRAEQVILATNGYSSEDLPDWLRGRTLPVQSSVIVTRPLTGAERAAQGWTTDQMAYDTRQLLHYFRALPDGRFLFGMRGGLRATPAAQARISGRIRADFARLFPAWRDVEITHEWSGLVCLMARLMPFVGAVPGQPGLLAALGFHGNGVAMGSYAGHLVAGQALGSATEGPEYLQQAPARFPLGGMRRWLLAPAYVAAEAFDL